MPTIPIYRQQTSVSGVPNMGRVSGQAMAAPFRAVEQVGQQIGQVVNQRMEEFDNLRADEAFNNLRKRQMELTMNPEQGFLSRRGAAAVDQDLIGTYENQFNAAIGEFEGTLGSERQKALFRQKAMVASNEYRGQLMRHVLNESNTYAQQVFQGTLAVETDRAVREWGDPISLNLSLERIDLAVMREAQRQGLDSETSAAMLRDARSKVHGNVVMAALDSGDVVAADAHLKRYGKEMGGIDLLKTRGMVQKELNQRIALGTATEVVSSLQPMLAPDDFDRLSYLVGGQESGNRQFDAQGNLIVSPAGAMGKMQIMEGTGPEAAKLAGEKWDLERLKTDEKYNEKLGKAYLAKQLERFDGDVAKALAAYNAGPGTVSNAVAKAEAQGEPGQWRKYMRDFQSQKNFEETQNYLDKILPKYMNGTKPARPTVEQVQSAVAQRLAGQDPAVIKLAQEEATRQYEVQNKAIKQREDEAYAEAIRVLEVNGGRYDAIPASVKAAVPPEKFNSLREYAGKVGKGVPVETDWTEYYKLKTNPQLLMQTNLAAVKPLLGDSEFKDLVGDQNKLREGGIGAANQLLSGNARIKQLMLEADIDSTPKPGTKEAKRVGQAYSYIQQQIDAKQATMGRILSPAEVNEVIDRSFMEVSAPGTMLFGLLPSKQSALQFEAAEKIKIPDADRKAIMDKLPAGIDVNDDQIVEIWLRWKGK